MTNKDDVRVLVINPGSTSTKVAVYLKSNPVFFKTLRHSSEDLEKFEKITDQFSFRKDIIIEQLHAANVRLDLIRIVMGRGGIVKPIPSGIYAVNEQMKYDITHARMEHASNLGALIADDIAKNLEDAKAYIADPVVVDEMDDIARYAGHPYFERISIFHALNQKAVARSHARSIMRKYEDLNLIVAHMGGGFSVGAHRKGRVVDVNQALDGEGPFSPERSGTLPGGDLVKLCFSGKYSEKEILKMIQGKGGLYAYMGTNSAYDVEMMAQDGDEKAITIFEAMAYQVAKAIGSMAAVLNGDVDGILLTGGVAHSKWFVDMIIKKIYRLAPTHVYPGEDEMKALARNGYDILNGEQQAKIYNP